MPSVTRKPPLTDLISERDALPVTDQFVDWAVDHAKRTWFGDPKQIEEEAFVRYDKWDYVKPHALYKDSADVYRYPDGEWVLPQVPYKVMISMIAKAVDEGELDEGTLDTVGDTWFID